MHFRTCPSMSKDHATVFARGLANPGNFSGSTGHAQHGFIESRREQVRLQEELSMKEHRNAQNRNMHEMGEIKRAQELRVDEVTLQKLTENHETILQENVLWKSIFYVWFTQRLFNLKTCKETEKQSLKQKGRRLVAQVQTDTIKAKHGPQVLQYPWIFRRTTWSDSKDSKYRTC